MHCPLGLILDITIYFSSMESSYKQKINAAMGSECSPEICDVTLIKCEKENILPNNALLVNYMRYRDNVLILFIGNENQVLELVNQPTPRPENHCEVETFPDLIIYRGKHFQKDGKLDTRVAIEKTDTFSTWLEIQVISSVFDGLIKGVQSI